LASVAILALVSVGDSRMIGPVLTGVQDRGMTVLQVWTGADMDMQIVLPTAVTAGQPP
jgi:hypothetical protein